MVCFLPYIHHCIVRFCNRFWCNMYFTLQKYTISLPWKLTVVYFRAVWPPWRCSSLSTRPGWGSKVRSGEVILGSCRSYQRDVVINKKLSFCSRSVDEHRKAKSTPAILAEIIKEEGVWVEWMLLDLLLLLDSTFFILRSITWMM